MHRLWWGKMFKESFQLLHKIKDDLMEQVFHFSLQATWSSTLCCQRPGRRTSWRNSGPSAPSMSSCKKSPRTFCQMISFMATLTSPNDTEARINFTVPGVHLLLNHEAHKAARTKDLNAASDANSC